jgi:hypothetical protein
MFPLTFPLSVLGRNSEPPHAVLDPFCGRGTTNFAARLLGMPSFGIDASPVAAAATAAKLVNGVTPSQIITEACNILRSRVDYEVPSGQFWSRAYKPKVLNALCKLRKALLDNCRSETRKALRGILLGALHGPLQVNGSSSYFSNQAPRTYAPKPCYAVSFWRKNGLYAPDVDVLDIIHLRAARFYDCPLPRVPHRVKCGDSRNLSTLREVCSERRARLIVTSPPYYGLRTYVADQWLRNWFVGGADHVDYSYGVQLTHRSISGFVSDLQRVWLNTAVVSHKNARLIFRFGAINDRSVDPREIIKASLRETPWRLATLVNAGTAQYGRRQSVTFGRVSKKPIVEFDAWALRDS